MAHRTHPRALFAPAPLAAAAALALSLPAAAQQAAVPAAPAVDAATAAADTAPATTTTITVTGRTPAPAVSGFGEQPLSSTPISARVLGERQLQDGGARQVADLVRFDAGLTDAYNAEGYWGNVSMRGYALDPRFNHRRDGLPISGETAIALDNKAGVELFKGTSGIQAGASAPGGLLNYTVKRPDRTVRSATLGWRENGTVGAAVDLSQRFGEDERYGLRLNAAAERLRPQTRDLHGERQLLALAGDVKLTRDTLLEAEVEHNRQSQPSVPGFSLRGDTVPNAHDIDPRTNLNNQRWSQPVVFDANTASLRLTQRLEGNWKLSAHAMTQRLRTDDRLAFPFGCSAENHYDRYCSNGSFDFYDYRSDNERRRSDALNLQAQGETQTGTLTHALTAGVLFTRFENRIPKQAFNFLDLSGQDDGSVQADPKPELTTDTVSRKEKTTEFYLRDKLRLDERNQFWLGLRHTRIQRDSHSSDGSALPPYEQSFNTPWVAFSHTVNEGLTAYASFGHGIESRTVPFVPTYSNPGYVLPAQRSRQAELGFKGNNGQGLQWNVAAFDIEQPYARDTGTSFTIKGRQHHRGLEASAEQRAGAWQLAASAMALRARIEDNDLDGNRPPNVPAFSLRLMAGHDVAALPGLNLQSWLVHEGQRTVLPTDDSPRIGGWTRVDLGARYVQRTDSTTLTWRAGVDNVFNRRAWRESPTLSNHVYLYPLAPRTFRVSLQADF
ncbi:TonB-dependent siderophore receptor [Azohydromonas lata]|uniref:TonB-dependent siderophore receptor n=1 Tax=Azohydromonas lata TaxID=45677 RepID=A0ABU5IMT3_9BURK|nr:TonB-dependent siderophore receptor [Azohydromonas lata]MDZ5460213.1 TonB-dependent siderophore receptor [Azohydromonas lata]